MPWRSSSCNWAVHCFGPPFFFGDSTKFVWSFCLRGQGKWWHENEGAALPSPYTGTLLNHRDNEPTVDWIRRILVLRAALIVIAIRNIWKAKLKICFCSGPFGCFIVLLFLSVFLRTNLAVVYQVCAHCQQYVIAGLFGGLKPWKRASNSTLWEVKLRTKITFFLCLMEVVSSHRPCMLRVSLQRSHLLFHCWTRHIFV